MAKISISEKRTQLYEFHKARLTRLSLEIEGAFFHYQEKIQNFKNFCETAHWSKIKKAWLDMPENQPALTSRELFEMELGR